MNVAVDVKRLASNIATSSIGIDLGLKDFAVCSNGCKVEAKQFYRDLEPALATALRAGKKARAKSIHAKIASRRKDFLHKLSTTLVKDNGAIFVGNVNASGLARTSMAKGVLDSGWSTFRTQLKYKCDNAAVVFKEVVQSYSTQECHVCHARTGPKGLAGLEIRTWSCCVCLTVHDRDVNAAKNILARGIAQMALKEISTSVEAKAVETEVNEAVGASATAGVGHDPLVAGIIVSSGR